MKSLAVFGHACHSYRMQTKALRSPITEHLLCNKKSKSMAEAIRSVSFHFSVERKTVRSKERKRQTALIIQIFTLNQRSNHNTPRCFRHSAESKPTANPADAPRTHPGKGSIEGEREREREKKENPKIKKRERGVVALEKMEQGGLAGSSPLTQTTPNTT